jgi:hypothetical protein
MAWKKCGRCGCAASGSRLREEVKQAVVREETEAREHYPFSLEHFWIISRVAFATPGSWRWLRLVQKRNADESLLVLFAGFLTFSRGPVVGAVLEQPVPDVTRVGDIVRVHPPARELQASSRSRGGGAHPPARVRRAGCVAVGAGLRQQSVPRWAAPHSR